MAVGMGFFMLCFGMTIGPGVWLYVPEIVQPQLVPLVTGVNWAAATVVIVFFSFLREVGVKENGNGSEGWSFVLFLFWNAASLYINNRFVVETK